MTRRIEKTEVFNAFKAREYWKQLRTRWELAAKGVEGFVVDIEDSALRLTVAKVIDACASGAGSYLIREAPGGFKIVAIALDDEIVDILVESSGEDMLEKAFDWIVDVLQDLPATFVAWAFGELALENPDSGTKYFACDRVVYGFRESRLLGVHTQPSYTNPKSKIIEIDFHKGRA